MWYKVHDLSWFLCRIWDKVVCGSSKILVFVAVGLLMVYRHPLLMEKSAQGVNMFFSKVCCLSFVTQKHWSNRSRRTNEALIRFKLQAGFDLVTFFFFGQYPIIMLVPEAVSFWPAPRIATSGLLGWSNTGSPQFTDFLSHLTNLVGWEYEMQTLPTLRKSGWVRGVVPGADQ